MSAARDFLARRRKIKGRGTNRFSYNVVYGERGVLRLERLPWSLAPCAFAVKPVGEPDAGNPHVRFDERGWETERCRMAQATAPILDSTRAAVVSQLHARYAVIGAPTSNRLLLRPGRPQ